VAIVALVKIYAGLSCLVGAMEIMSGLVVAGMHVSHGTVKLFNTFGVLGAFGPVELVWLGISTVAAVIFVKKGIPFLPAVLFIAFCLVHPLIIVLCPDTAAVGGDAAFVLKSPAAGVGIVFGAAYVLFNCFYYKGYFLAPRLFEK
jgi:hypothetical protein